jgi:F-type H+-transporting ATPase subunit gamma
MELVAATKMRRSQELALNSRPYAYTALEILAVISHLKEIPMPELLQERPVEKTAFLIVTSDKGLAGSFNGSVLRTFENYVRTNAINLHDPKYSFIAVGQKAKSYLEHRDVRVAHSFTRVGDFTKLQEVEPLADILISGYLKHAFDEVTVFSTNFVTALRQEVLIRQIMPVTFEKIKESIELLVPQAGRYAKYLDEQFFKEEKEVRYIIEPSAAEVLSQLAHTLLRIRIYHIILEANASEHSARRVAMKNASDNASELSNDLNVEYNKSRQAAITNQLIEIASGAEALR